MIKILKKIFILTTLLLGIYTICICVYANTNDAIEKEIENYKLNDMVNTLEQYTEGIDLNTVKEDLLEGNGLDMPNIFNAIGNVLFREIKIELKTAVEILMVLVLIGIIKCLELEEGSLNKVVNILSFLILTSMILKNYTNILTLFKNTIANITNITEIISPVILGILIATGEVVTSGIIGPVIMFLTSLVGIAVNYIIMPLLNISLVFRIISSVSDAVNLDKLGGFLSSSAMWITSIAFTIVLGVLGLETSVSTSVDEITVKTTQAAISNLVPVVGKFVSDSTEIVMGASEVIGKAIGVIGILVIFIVLLLPALKILLIGGIYSLVEGISETLVKDNKITGIVGTFAKQYNKLAGIMIGVGVTFVITIAIAISLIGRAVGS
ncbi:MAG: stage III sporulation protein AE [Clostridia bacterium]|nr:stage III sporulation protein AE [Clostridia bacterium]